MSDLFAPLRDLAEAPTDPLPPAEVRRRGDRRRRLRTGAQTFAAAATMAVVAVGAVTVADRSTSSSPAPPASQDPSPSELPSPTPSGTPSEPVGTLTLGPTGIGEIRLGMALGALNASGLLEGKARSCLEFETSDGLVRGIASDSQGVVHLEVRRKARTPEGIGFDATESDLHVVYRDLVLSNAKNTLVGQVPGHPGARYLFTIGADGYVSEMALTQDEQHCAT